jgi:hypothetical protein
MHSNRFPGDYVSAICSRLRQNLRTNLHPAILGWVGTEFVKHSVQAATLTPGERAQVVIQWCVRVGT